MLFNMKRIILALFAVSSIATANAQKGSILLYGNLGIGIENVDNGPTAPTGNWTSWNVTPGVGYQFTNAFTVGIQGGFGSRINKTTVSLPTRDSSFKNTWNDWSAGVFVRHTHNLGNLFSIWNQLDLSYISGTQKMENMGAITTTGEDTYNGFMAMLTPAIAVNVHEGWKLNFSFGGIGFSTQTWDIAPVTETRFNFNFGQQVNFGITKNFACGTKKHHHDPGMHMKKMKKHDADEDDE